MWRPPSTAGRFAYSGNIELSYVETQFLKKGVQLYPHPPPPQSCLNHLSDAISNQSTSRFSSDLGALIKQQQSFVDREGDLRLHQISTTQRRSSRASAGARLRHRSGAAPERSFLIVFLSASLGQLLPDFPSTSLSRNRAPNVNIGPLSIRPAGKRVEQALG